MVINLKNISMSLAFIAFVAAPQAIAMSAASSSAGMSALEAMPPLAERIKAVEASIVALDGAFVKIDRAIAANEELGEDTTSLKTKRAQNRENRQAKQTELEELQAMAAQQADEDYFAPFRPEYIQRMRANADELGKELEQFMNDLRTKKLETTSDAADVRATCDTFVAKTKEQAALVAPLLTLVSQFAESVAQEAHLAECATTAACTGRRQHEVFESRYSQACRDLTVALKQAQQILNKFAGIKDKK